MENLDYLFCILVLCFISGLIGYALGQEKASKEKINQ
jgi:hypothetical protein